MSNVAQLPSTSRFRSFWHFQLGGWLLYATEWRLRWSRFRNMRADVGIPRHVSLIGLCCSFLMYGVCHALWRARVPLIRALLTCTIVAYGLGPRGLLGIVVVGEAVRP